MLLSHLRSAVPPVISFLVQNLITRLLFALSPLFVFWLLVSSAFSVLKNRGSLPGLIAFGYVPRFCFTVLFFMLILALFLFFFSWCWPGFNFFAYIVYIYKLYINTYIYYLILSLLQICMFPGFVFCTSYARTHVYSFWFAVSAMKARTHFCVLNGVVFSVDGVFLVLVRLRAVCRVPACYSLFISARLASLFSFLRISAILVAEFHVIFTSILYLKRLFLCFDYIFTGFLYT